MSRLDHPSMKCFVSSLLKSRKTDNVNGMNVWSMESGYTFSIVWIQGTVADVSSNKFQIDDSSGSCTVYTTPASTLGIKIEKNAYLMVIGELLNNVDQVVLRSIKVQDLTQERELKEIWPLEVQEMFKIYR